MGPGPNSITLLCNDPVSLYFSGIRPDSMIAARLFLAPEQTSESTTCPVHAIYMFVCGGQSRHQGVLLITSVLLMFPLTSVGVDVWLYIIDIYKH